MFLLLPARLGQARDLAAKRDFTNLVTRQPEFTERAARTTGNCATIALTSRVGVARQLLQFKTCRVMLFFRLAHVANDCLQCSTLGSVLGGEASTLLFTFDQCQFSHGNLSF